MQSQKYLNKYHFIAVTSKIIHDDQRSRTGEKGAGTHGESHPKTNCYWSVEYREKFPCSSIGKARGWSCVCCIIGRSFMIIEIIDFISGGKINKPHSILYNRKVWSVIFHNADFDASDYVIYLDTVQRHSTLDIAYLHGNLDTWFWCRWRKYVKHAERNQLLCIIKMYILMYVLKCISFWHSNLPHFKNIYLLTTSANAKYYL